MNELPKDFLKRIANAVVRQKHSQSRKQILDSLPVYGDKNYRGRTRRQISRETRILPKRVSGYLQTLKRQHKARCYRGKWRQTKPK